MIEEYLYRYFQTADYISGWKYPAKHMLNGPFSLKQKQKSIHGCFSVLLSLLPLRDHFQASLMNSHIKKGYMMQLLSTGILCK